ncbi:hypothetical protein [Nonomuraea jabiensis]
MAPLAIPMMVRPGSRCHAPVVGPAIATSTSRPAAGTYLRPSLSDSRPA